LTCDARKNIDFSQLELADHGGRRLIRIVGGEVEQRSTLAADLCRDDAHARAYTEGDERYSVPAGGRGMRP